MGRVKMRGASYGLIGSVLMLLAQSALPAWADGKDCPLLGMLDNFFGGRGGRFGTIWCKRK
jgi:hypothetical protein